MTRFEPLIPCDRCQPDAPTLVEPHVRRGHSHECTHGRHPDAIGQRGRALPESASPDREGRRR